MPLCPVGTLRKELDATEGGFITSLPSLSVIDGEHIRGFAITGKLCPDTHAEVTGYQFFIISEGIGTAGDIGCQPMPKCRGDCESRQRKRKCFQWPGS